RPRRARWTRRARHGNGRRLFRAMVAEDGRSRAHVAPAERRRAPTFQSHGPSSGATWSVPSAARHSGSIDVRANRRRTDVISRGAVATEGDLTIGDVARRSGLRTSALRYY